MSSKPPSDEAPPPSKRHCTDESRIRASEDVSECLKAEFVAEVKYEVNDAQAQDFSQIVNQDSKLDEQQLKAEKDTDETLLKETEVRIVHLNGEGSSSHRCRKRKVAMFFAYCGAKYQGMQRNPNAITIEGALEEALHKAGGISDENFGDPHKVDWTRAARTDKGVSAVGQVVSAKIMIDAPDFSAKLSQFLPSDIVCLGYKRVISSFNAKHLCDRRRYEYLIPTFAFNPEMHRDRQHYLEAAWEEEDEKFVQIGMNCGSKLQPGKLYLENLATEIFDGESGNLKSSPPVDDKSEAFSFTQEMLQQLNNVLGTYCGTHNFHNFTSRVKPEDPSANRFIISFEAKDTISILDVEFVRCQVVGQSFMLHQIRKMIGLAVAVLRKCVPHSFISKAMKKENKVLVPMAPELGLFLDESMFHSYNRKFQSSHEEISLSSFSDKAEEFKQRVIYPHIASTEKSDHTFETWLKSLNDRNFPDFEEARGDG